MGFSSSTRATESQAPEGKVVFALCLLKASAVPDEGNKGSQTPYDVPASTGTFPAMPSQFPSQKKTYSFFISLKSIIVEIG